MPDEPNATQPTKPEPTTEPAKPVELDPMTKLSQDFDNLNAQLADLKAKRDQDARNAAAMIETNKKLAAELTRKAPPAPSGPTEEERAMAAFKAAFGIKETK